MNADAIVTAICELEEVETLLAAWLTDNTVEVFEEEGEIDDARGRVQTVIELLRGAS